MKKIKNKSIDLFKTICLLIGISLLLIGCESAEDIKYPIEEQFLGEHVEEVSFEQIKNDPLFIKAYREFELDEFGEQLSGKSFNSAGIKFRN